MKLDKGAQIKKLNFHPRIVLGVTALFLLVVCLFLFVFLFSDESGIRAVPINLHSVLAADYRADPRGLRQPGIQIGLIEDIINDRGNGYDEITTIQAILNTPIFTITPGIIPTNFIYSPTPMANQTPNSSIATPTPTYSVISTPGSSRTTTPTQMGTHSMTSAPSSTANTTSGTASRTPQRTLSSTPGNYPTPTPSLFPMTNTSTNIPPTATPLPTSTPFPTPTSTPSPSRTPTATRIPTSTPIPYPYP